MAAEASIRPVIHKAKRRKIYLWDKADIPNLQKVQKFMKKFLEVFFQADPTSKTLEETWNEFKEATYSSIESN